MSDDSKTPPPSLRLRPRLSAGEAEASSHVGANASRADGSASAGGADNAPAPQKIAIRLRPRLNADSKVGAPRSADLPEPSSVGLLSAATISATVPPASSSTIPPADAVQSVPTIRLQSRSAAETQRDSTGSKAALRAPSGDALSPAVPDELILPPSKKEPVVPLDGGKLKLRFADAVMGDPSLLVGALPERPPLGESSPSSLVAPIPGPAIKRTPPPFPVLAATPKAPPPPRIPHLEARGSASADSGSPVRKPKGTPALALLLGLAVAGSGAYFGWMHFKKVPPAASPAAVAQRPVTSSETRDALSRVPIQAIQKTQEVLALRQEGVNAVADAMATETEFAGKHSPRPASPVPVLPPPMAGTTATTTVAPGLSASMPIVAAADASAAYREFVANAKISGVAETRALINGRLVRIGEMVDSTLGIRFHAVDRDTKQLIFKDFNGAQVARRY